MKSIILIVISTLLLSTINHTHAQTASVPQNQTFNLDEAKAKSSPKDEASLTKNSTLTTNKAVSGNNTYPVYVTKNGKLFIVVKSKNGNFYKKYIKTD